MVALHMAFGLCPRLCEYRELVPILLAGPRFRMHGNTMVFAQLGSPVGGTSDPIALPQTSASFRHMHIHPPLLSGEADIGFSNKATRSNYEAL